MYYFLTKTLITALIIAGASELSKWHNFIAAILLSLPLTSILAFVWTYHDTHDTQKIIDLSFSVLFLVIPSLLFFVTLPFLLKQGLHFYHALLISCFVTFLSYKLYLLCFKTN